MTKPHILILGAGSTGLSIAQALKAINIPFTVFEKTTATSHSHDRDWSMALHWGSDFIESLLPSHLKDALSNAVTDANITLTEKQKRYITVLNGETGDVVTDFDAGTTRRVSRARLREVVLGGLEGNVNFGWEARGIELRDTDGSRMSLAEQIPKGDKSTERVTVHFTNGSQVNGDIVIGCDSASSFVRQWLFSKPGTDTRHQSTEIISEDIRPPPKNSSASLTELPIIIYNFTVSFTADQARWLHENYHPLLQVSAHPHLRTRQFISTLDARDEDPSKWIFQILMYHWVGDESSRSSAPSSATSNNPPGSAHIAQVNTPRTSAERLSHYKSLCTQYAEPFNSIGKWIPENTYIPLDKLRHWSNITLWNNRDGRVTLAGDAAHAMAPNRGQGLNNALQDAWGFVRAVKMAYCSDLDEEGQGEGYYDDERGNREERDKMFKKLLDEYDKEVYVRGKKEIEISAKQAYAATHFEVYLESAGVKFGFKKAE